MDAGSSIFKDGSSFLGSASTLVGASPDASSSSGGHGFLSAPGSSVATELRIASVEELMVQEVDQVAQVQQHQHRTLEAWCKEEFHKLNEQQTSQAASIKSLGDEIRTGKEEQKATTTAVQTQVSETNANVNIMLKNMTEMMKRLPPQQSRKRTDLPDGAPEGKEEVGAPPGPGGQGEGLARGFGPGMQTGPGLKLS